MERHLKPFVVYSVMGKYELDVIEDLEIQKTRQLNNISNELAEANRLKRLELENSLNMSQLLTFSDLKERA